MKTNQFIFAVVLLFGTFFGACTRLENVEPEQPANYSQNLSRGARVENFSWEEYLIPNPENPYEDSGKLYNMFLDFLDQNTNQDADLKTLIELSMKYICSQPENQEICEKLTYEAIEKAIYHHETALDDYPEEVKKAVFQLQTIMENKPKLITVIPASSTLTKSKFPIETLQKNILKWEYFVMQSNFSKEDQALLLKFGANARYGSAYWHGYSYYKSVSTHAGIRRLQPFLCGGTLDLTFTTIVKSYSQQTTYYSSDSEIGKPIEHFQIIFVNVANVCVVQPGTIPHCDEMQLN